MNDRNDIGGTVPEDRASCPVAAAAREYPGATAVIQETEISMAAFSAMVASRADLLAAWDIRKGDRVMMAATPSLACCATLWSLFRVGAVACPVNPAIPPLQMAEIVKLLRPMCALGMPSFPIPGVRCHVLEDPDPEPAVARDAAVDLAAPATLVLTSGSSGAPKAAAHSLGSHLEAARYANQNMPLGPGDRWLVSLPLYHVAGLAILFRCILAGAALALPRPGVALAQECARLGATHLSLVPTQLRRFLTDEAGTDRVRSMKAVLLGGAPCEEELIARALKAGVPLTRSYGMTETAAQICATPPGASAAQILSSGTPLAPDTLRIAHDGVIEVQGPTLFLGYYAHGAYHRPETADGWFRTGDIGWVDADGCLHVTGRADAMFISGGENIYPEEIEGALCRLPGMTRAVVVPVPHPDFGLVPVAFVALDGDASVDETTLRTSLEALLPRFKIPKRIFPWPHSIASDGIKIDRAAFAKEAWCRVEEQHWPP